MINQHYTYLLINLLSVFFPIVLGFDKKVRFYTTWKYLLPAIIITGCMFLTWDYIFTLNGVWSFNSKYITGIHFLNLPVEEILFFITIPFACVFIYECLNFYLKKDLLFKASRAISIALIITCIIMLANYHTKLYSLVNFGFLLLLLLLSIVVNAKYMGRFYAAYVVALIPFYIVNGILTSLPVVLYNDNQNMNFRIGSIPFEDHFYLMSMLLMNIALLEFFRKKTDG
ncbi:lycopene cyclase domain-containing protein [Pedobacter sp. HMF7647]|uniref:Lycopene cyclase domain-containing protein n=1 Tax=Hufsiella arboris TaxID=2695275 RepID=A0A7K1YEG1_9SPHI|nr:lycopene cyclase domain-containing protein [Hufsiella arboris]MXV52972.1 lycopene cyclase domain-containing protein [Hufsiella arboris]